MRFPLSLVTVVVLATTPHADAQPAAPDRVVLAVDGRDVYVELGARDGVGAGTQLELLHEVVARDPRTGRALRDHFALGTLVVQKSGDKISVARAAPELAKRVIAGDRVRVISPLRKFADPWAAQVAASKQGAGAPAVTPPPTTAQPQRAPGGPAHPADPAELVKAAWQDTLGQSPEARVQRWLAYLAADPRSPYVAAVQKEIAMLREQIAARDAALAAARSVDRTAREPRIARLAAALPPSREDADGPLLAAPIATAEPGQPIALAFAIRVPARAARGWLFVRTAGQPGFQRSELVVDGDAYLRGAIAAAVVRAPGVEWYVEVASADPAAEPEPALGSQGAPRTIEVEALAAEAPIAHGRSHVDLHVDYVDFDGKLSNGFDQYYQAELDFSYRFLDPIHAVRLGFGTLSGKGGPKDVIDGDETGNCLDDAGVYRCKEVTFSYVYTEFEHRIRPNIALMVRPQAGVLTTDESLERTNDCQGRDIDNCRFTTRLGLRARLRLGDELGTNLVIGAAFTDDVGTLLEAAYNWMPSRHIPVQLAVHVTDQPVPEDFGVRLVADVGWRKLSWFYPSARLSYQARDIDHAGISGGAALNFDW